jgi:hypothetical protein
MASQRTFRGLLSFAILAALALALALAACSSVPPSPRDLLDEHTGATVTAVGAPFTFVRQPDGEASRTFLTLVAIQKDDAGKYTQLLLLYRWSVFYGPGSTTPEESTGKLLIEIDGHSIELQPLQKLPAGLPKPKDLFVPDTTEAALRAYLTDVETMRMIATSHELTVKLSEASPGGPFELWRDGRPALAQFVKQLSGP